MISQELLAKHRVRMESEEVLYSTDEIVRVGPDTLEFLKNQAALLPRRRIRLCTHPGVENSLHEMIIVHGRDAYVRPHKHLGKAESLHLIEGSARVLLFEDDGTLADSIALSVAVPRGNIYYRMESSMFHSLLIDSDWLVFHEVTEGPFRREQTTFASWAPVEDQAGLDFLRGLVSK